MDGGAWKAAVHGVAEGQAPLSDFTFTFTFTFKFERVLKTSSKDFPGGPVVKTLNFQCRGPGSNPVQGTKILDAVWQFLISLKIQLFYNPAILLLGIYPREIKICCCQVASVVSDSVRPHGLQPTRLLHPWDSPGKNTGVGCHFLLQCRKVKVKSLSCV